MSDEGPQFDVVRRQREPSSWTLPLQRVSAAFLAVLVVWSLVSNVAFDRAQASEPVSYAGSLVVIVLLAAVGVVLAVGSLRRSLWAFWLGVVALAFVGIDVIPDAYALAHPAARTQPRAAIIVGLALSAASLALLAWFVVAAVRFGPWAMRRPAPKR